MAKDVERIRARLRRLERQARGLETGRLDWLAYVPRETFLGPWPPGTPPAASRLRRELEVLNAEKAAGD